MFVCIVDDDSAVGDSLAALLECHDYRTEVFSSAEDFLASAALSEVACIIADVRLPGMTGLEMVEHIRRQGCQTPVLIISGHGEFPQEVRQQLLRPIRYLEKPCHPADLLATILEVT